jgi:hypothetical protein
MFYWQKGGEKMPKMNLLDWIVLILVVVGGLNWGLVGILGVDLVAAIFGAMTMLTRIVYSLVGLAALYMLVMTFLKK